MHHHMLRLSLMASVLALLTQLPMTGTAGQKAIQVPFVPSSKPFVIAAEERFIDNGDGTVTDTKQRIMWQKDDNGKEVTFEDALQYCKTLRLGGYTDWRLPRPDERDTGAVVELLMPLHSRDAHAYFDLYWSSDPTAMIPFNYRPSQGREVSRVYFARGRARAFVRAVRSLGSAKPDSGG